MLERIAVGTFSKGQNFVYCWWNKFGPSLLFFVSLTRAVPHKKDKIYENDFKRKE